MKHNEWIRQGDVALTAVDRIPEDATPIKTVPLAWGEVTGHSHRFAVEDEPNVQMYRCRDGTVMVQVLKPVTLVHEEHAHQEVKPGTYQVGIQREFDLVAGVRKVMD